MARLFHIQAVIKKFTLGLAILLSVNAFAEESSAPEKEETLQAILLMTNNVELALENWSKSSPGVYIPSTNTVVRGEPIEALVVFSGCKPNMAGNCNTDIDFHIIKPDGTPYVEYLEKELWRNKPAIPEGKIGLAVDRVGFIAEPDDPAGTYKVVCVLRDHVAELELTITATFTVSNERS